MAGIERQQAVGSLKPFTQQPLAIQRIGNKPIAHSGYRGPGVHHARPFDQRDGPFIFRLIQGEDVFNPAAQLLCDSKSQSGIGQVPPGLKSYTACRLTPTFAASSLRVSSLAFRADLRLQGTCLLMTLMAVSLRPYASGSVTAPESLSP